MASARRRFRIPWRPPCREAGWSRSAEVALRYSGDSVLRARTGRPPCRVHRGSRHLRTVVPGESPRASAGRPGSGAGAQPAWGVQRSQEIFGIWQRAGQACKPTPGAGCSQSVDLVEVHDGNQRGDRLTIAGDDDVIPSLDVVNALRQLGLRFGEGAMFEHGDLL